MFAFLRKRSGPDPVGRLHAEIVAASRRPELYGPERLPDTTEGRFEALALHVFLVLRRLRRLPPPADDVAQELVDAVFAHLEVALRETGVGDFGVPKRMKKLARAFYDRAAKYDPLLERADEHALADEIAGRLDIAPAAAASLARATISSASALERADLSALLTQGIFSRAEAELAEAAS